MTLGDLQLFDWDAGMMWTNPDMIKPSFAGDIMLWLVLWTVGMVDVTREEQGIFWLFNFRFGGTSFDEVYIQLFQMWIELNATF